MGIFARAFANGSRPVKSLSVSEFAELKMYNPSNTADAGKFSIDRAPYQKAIMDALTPGNGITDVVAMMGAQLGKTFIGQVWQAFIMDIDPQNFISYQPTIAMAESYVSLKIDPMIEANPFLKELFKKRESSTKSKKKYKGCNALYLGANSANSFRMISAPNVDIDECDSFEHDIQGEGNPMDLIVNRTATFGKRAKRFWHSTPTIEGMSAIEKKFLQGNQQYYHVPCPFCNAKQTFKLTNLRCDRKTVDGRHEAIESSIYYECEICKAHITEDKKTWMLMNGEWIAMNPEAPKHIVSFQISSLYSPLGWLSWKDILDKFFDSKDEPFSLKSFKNTYLGETYADNADQPEYKKIARRAERYDLGFVPSPAVFLYAGVDTQPNRLAVTVTAFGCAMESWVIYYEELLGDPDNFDVWERLTTILKRPYFHESGCELHILKAAIDTGGKNTTSVYDYCRRNQDLCFAIKGASHDIGHFIKESARVDKDPRTGKELANPLRLYLVNGNLIKKYIYSALNVMISADKQNGEKVIHFSDELQQNFYEMLVAERYVRKIINGRMVESFVPPTKSTRNEVLDCMQYLYAIAFMDGIHHLYGHHYEKKRQIILDNAKKRELKKKQAEDVIVKSEQVKRPSKKKSFVNKTGFAIRR